MHPKARVEANIAEAAAWYKPIVNVNQSMVNR
jgi:hypothetical protein